MPTPPNHFHTSLAYLRQLLEGLPSTLPLGTAETSRYHSFLSFSLDNDLMEKIEDEASVVSAQIKDIFGWKSRTTGDGILPIEERGKPICAIVDVLSHYHNKYPQNDVLKKWCYDLITAAEKVYQTHRVKIPDPPEQLSRPRGSESSIKRPALAVESDDERTVIDVDDNTSENGDAESSKASSTKNLLSTKAKRGRPEKPLMARLVTKSFAPGSKKVVSYTCIGCNEVRKWNPQEDRVLKHASTCSKLDPVLKREAISASTDSSLGAKLQQNPSNSPAASSATEQPAAKRLKTIHLEPDRTAGSSQAQGKFAATVHEAGQKRKQEERVAFQAKADHLIMRLMCVNGLVPRIVDSDEWKELMYHLNPAYTPTSAKKFADDYIPKEANYVREQQAILLKQSSNLTLTFDGGATRRDSIYFAHATTPGRESYLLDGHVGSDERHTQAWVKDKVLATARSIGEHKWAGVCSDSTSVTKGARRDIVTEIPTMLDLCDVCHHIHNTIQDITKLSAFKPMLSILRSIVKYFSKSTHARAVLRKQVTDGGEKIKALKKIGKTRFGTHWTAAQALMQCLPKLRELVQAKEIKFTNKKVQSMFMNRVSSDYNTFELGLLQYVATIEPFIRSLWSLESSQANASDAYVFWLAIAASLRELFDQDSAATGISPSLANDISKITNDRFKQFFGNNLYLVAFALDRRYPTSDILLKPAVAPPTIVIPPTQKTSATDKHSDDVDSPDSMPHPRTYHRLKEFLKDMLRKQLERHDTHPDEPVHPVIDKLGEYQASQDLRRQLEAFWKGEYPFNDSVKNNDVLAWWEDLARHPHAQVLAMLAIQIFSILVNSMPDERTGSKFTWLNSALRGNQHAQTLIDMVQIGQWYESIRNREKKLKKVTRPTVKFRDIDKDLLRTVSQPSQKKIAAQPDFGLDDRANLDEDEDGGDEAEDGEDDEDDEDSDDPRQESIQSGDPDELVTSAAELLPGSDVNLRAPVLRDLLSTEPVMPSEPRASATASDGQATGAQAEHLKKKARWDW